MARCSECSAPKRDGAEQRREPRGHEPTEQRSGSPFHAESSACADHGQAALRAPSSARGRKPKCAAPRGAIVLKSIDQADDGLGVPFQTVAQLRVCPSRGPKARGEVSGRSRQRVIARAAHPLLMRAPGRSNAGAMPAFQHERDAQVARFRPPGPPMPAPCHAFPSTLNGTRRSPGTSPLRCSRSFSRRPGPLCPACRAAQRTLPRVPRDTARAAPSRAHPVERALGSRLLDGLICDRHADGWDLFRHSSCVNRWPVVVQGRPICHSERRPICHVLLPRTPHLSFRTQ